MRLLPPPPRATSVGRLLKRVLLATFIGVLGAGMLGGMGYYAHTLTDRLVEDRAIYANGVAAQDGDIKGTSRTRRVFFHEYKLTLNYTDEAGNHHAVEQEFDTVLGEVDKDDKVEIRYDRAHPERAASSWSVDVTGSRVLWALLSAAGSALGGFVVYAGIKAARDAFLERDAARDGIEVAIKLVESSRDQYGNVTYAMAVDVAAGQTITGSVTLGKTRAPFWLGAGKGLGIYSERLCRVFLVEADGLPVALTRDEVRAARDRRDASTETAVG